MNALIQKSQTLTIWMFKIYEKICLIVPYYGKLPPNFQIWLNSCKYNNTINWIVFTDDRTNYEYPSNVTVVNNSFEELSKKIQSLYDFKFLSKDHISYVIIK
jgi:hypothetical protein